MVRLLTGVSAGIGICVGPIYISEIAPSQIKGSVGMCIAQIYTIQHWACIHSVRSGVLTQFAIVIGIMITQSMGLQLANPRKWRLVLLFSSALSLAQLLVGPLIVESPVWLTRHGLLRDKDASARRLWRGAPALHTPEGTFRASQPQ